VIGFLGQFQWKRALPLLQFLVGEAPRQTGTIQDKIVIWAAHQPVKNESVVEFSTPQEDSSCKELEDRA
jgi:hypothetical protein